MIAKTLAVQVCGKDLMIRNTRGTAIKAHCADCSAGTRVEVRECPHTLCPLYTFRGYIEWDNEIYSVQGSAVGDNDAEVDADTDSEEIIP